MTPPAVFEDVEAPKHIGRGVVEHTLEPPLSEREDAILSGADVDAHQHCAAPNGHMGKHSWQYGARTSAPKRI